MYELSTEYAELYNGLLRAVGTSAYSLPNELTAFWPMRGHLFDGDLFVIGRTTNGWYKTWSKHEAMDTAGRLKILGRARSYSEADKRCPLLWVTDRAGDPEYNTNASAFWRVIRRISLEGNYDRQRANSWPSWICWSNLLKVAPASMRIQPSSALKRAQLSIGIQLITQELAEFNPRRVLVLAGQDWFSPYSQGLGLNVKWLTGLVEGTATMDDRRWVIAKHPMGKPENELVDEVLEGFASRLGS